MASHANNSTSAIPFVPQSFEFAIVKIAILTFIGVAALVGNLMATLSILIPKNMRSPTNYLLLNLALLDIITVSLRLPIHLINIMENKQAIDDPLCQFHAFLTGLCFIGTVYSMVAIAVFRYIVVCRSLSVKLTNLHSLYAIILIWVTSVFICVWPFWGWSSFIYNPVERTCIPSYSEDTSGLINGIIEIFLDFGIPLTTIFICYLKVYLYVKSTLQDLAAFQDANYLRREERKRRITLTMWIVFVAFFILYAPWSLLTFVVFPVSQGKANVPDSVFFLSQACIYANSAINPTIYGVMMRQFSRQYKILLTCSYSRSNIVTVSRISENKEQYRSTPLSYSISKNRRT